MPSHPMAPTWGTYDSGDSETATCNISKRTPKVKTSAIFIDPVHLGDTVSDDVFVSGDGPTPTGTVDFFLCEGADVTAAGCPAGGTLVGDDIAARCLR